MKNVHFLYRNRRIFRHLPEDVCSQQAKNGEDDEPIVDLKMTIHFQANQDSSSEKRKSNSQEDPGNYL